MTVITQQPAFVPATTFSPAPVPIADFASSSSPSPLYSLVGVRNTADDPPSEPVVNRQLQPSPPADAPPSERVYSNNRNSNDCCTLPEDPCGQVVCICFASDCLFGDCGDCGDCGDGW
ncbi:hypothetical protein [Candidatus Regiella endosymbiont of Tuberolachnus salignus]|uniref:hypothetical protein n=1 Tax=Candidatus Regiella endosymbiont of Tuberolachnus salignus TaxID=3077956 RepID=UPI0030CF6B33